MSPQRQPTPRVRPVSPRQCSVADTLAIVGDRWSLLVVRELVFGEHRFDAIQRRTGAARDVLAARLRKLEDAGIIGRRRYSVHPPRHEYLLTQAGRDLWPVLLALQAWGDRHLNPNAEPVVLRHTCGHAFHAVPACQACGHPLGDGELAIIGGTDPPTTPLAV